MSMGILNRKEAGIKIAQIGAFDGENFGDLLFPTAIEERFKNCSIDLFSPVGGMEKPFEQDRYVYSVKQLEERCKSQNYRLILIGGGDLIRVDKNIAANYSSNYEAGIALWQYPILIANKYQIPVVFNAPGVPMEFSGSEQQLTKLLLQNVDYISVRDHRSKEYLQKCGVTDVQVIPDTVYSIPEYFKKEELHQIKEDLVEKAVLPAWDNYIIFQHNTVNEEDLQELRKILDWLTKEKTYNVLLMPIGYVHSDSKFMEKLMDEGNERLFFCKEKLTPKEMCAVLSMSSGYIGTSMHGAIVSYAYGKQIVSINTAKMSKITGFLELIHKEDAEVHHIKELKDVVEKQFSMSYQKEDYDQVCQKVERHFRYIEEKYIDHRVQGNRDSSNIFNILEQYHEIAEQVKSFAYQNFEIAKVYYDYGEGYSETNSDEYEYTRRGEAYQLSIPIMQEVKNLRIDPVENQIAVLKNIKVRIDGKDAVYSIPYSCNYQDGLILNSLDPMIMISDVKGEMLTIEYQAEIINDDNICQMIAYWNERNIEVEELRKQLEQLQSRVEAIKVEKEAIEAEKEAIEAEKTALEDRVFELEEESEADKAEVRRLTQENADLVRYISEIYESLSWKVSKPVRAVGNSGRWLIEHSKILHKGHTAVKILQQGGVKLLVHDIKHYDEIKAMQAAAENRGVEEVYVDSEYQDNIDFSDQNTDVKMLAFYLPQYHTFPENDEWWGKGFTEWTNVRSGDSRFEGHYQPRVPHTDIGYYDLSDIEVMRKQAILAKQHGIYGFCFYYYWFSGKRLMEKPVDMLLEHPEIDLPFCLCWANENWTRAWDGQNKNVLIAQDYSEDDDIRFMKDLKKYIDDERYIRINGKPLVMVYNPGQIPDCHKSFAKWREVAKEIGLGDILIWTCQTSNNTATALKITDCIDAEVEFPPHNMWMESAAIRNVDLHGKSAFLYSYPAVVETVIENMKQAGKKRVPVHHGCMLAWDNAARRKDAWFTYCGFSLKSLYKWVLAISEKAREDFAPEERFVFINAWNEWGEGTYLEPDEKYGYANINTVSKALMQLPLENDLRVVNLDDQEMPVEKFEKKDNESRIAVQIHMFYLDTLEETISYLNKIPYAFDCYISTDSEEKKKQIEAMMHDTCKCKKACVEVYKNRGRDVAPFLVQMQNRIADYDYVCHIHSKKTKTNDHGNEWRKYIFRNLFGNSEYLKRIFEIFESNPKIGILMPETYPVLELQAEWGGNKEGVSSLLEKLGIKTELPQNPVFPVGNMFWARAEAVKKIFEHGFEQTDFPQEAGQVNATIAHQIERSWIYLIKSEGYSYQKVFNNCYIPEREFPKKKRLLAYVHYDKENVISEDDIKTIDTFSKICDEVLFATNTNLSEAELEKVSKYTDHILKRENEGYDFGAWKELLLGYTREKVNDFEEVILLNNSCYAPAFDITEMFSVMEEKNLDFWGNTVFPKALDGSYMGKDYIPEHIQSYFMVFSKKVLESDAFWNFWENLPECKEFIEVIANCESQFTKILSDAGFTYEPYIKETYYISRFLNNYAIPYEKPCSLLLLKDPFVKKKCYQYMSEVERVRLEYFLEMLKR